MNMKSVWISILVIVLVFTFALTITRTGETMQYVAAYANAWSIDLGAGSWDVYASGSAYAAATMHGPGNEGNLSVSAYAYMVGDTINYGFLNGGGHPISASGELNFPASSSGTGNVTSLLGSDAAAASS